ncbi:MAG: penicillin-binding transpeptidase domain-containing protein [Clostridia bacterium]
MKFSSNVLFSHLGTELGADRLKEAAERFMVTKKIPFDIDTSASEWPYGKMSETELASVGIGQGKLLTTPFNMAMAASAIANNGVMMKPYLVQKAVSPNGVVVYDASPEALTRVTTTSVAYEIGEYMLECVNSVTGTNAKIRGIEVAGKTGTAQNEREGKDHAWFVAFAPKDDPQIAVAVFQEYSGSSGGAACAPIARDIIKKWLQ